MNFLLALLLGISLFRFGEKAFALSDFALASTAARRGGMQQDREVSLKGEHYLSKPGESYQFQDYFSLFADLSFEEQKRRFFFKAHAQSEFYFKSSDFYITVPELFFSYKWKPVSGFQFIKIYAGRHIKEWSAADRYWEFGYWNPLNLWDPLYPSQNGLIGAFLDIKSGGFLLEFYVGGVHPPHVKPKLKEDKSGYISSSRYGLIPPRQAEFERFGGRALDIDYLVDFFFQRLLHDSYILSLSYLSKNKAAGVKGSVGIQSANDVYLTGKGGLNVTKKGLEVQQNVSNHPVSQTAFSIEASARWKGMSALASMNKIHARPQRSLPEGVKFVTAPSDHDFISAFWDYSAYLWPELKAKLRLSWIHSFFSGAAPRALLRHKILKGGGIESIAEFLPQGRVKAKGEFKYWRALKSRESLFSLILSVYPLSGLYFSAGLNVLTGSSRGQGFLTRFSSNDSIIWKAGYVF